MSENIEVKSKKPFYRKWWFGLIMFFIVLRIASGGKSSEHSSSGATKSTEAHVNLPADEIAFIETISDSQSKSRNTANDMQRGGIKAARDKILCQSMKRLKIKNWIGTIKSVDANSDGKGILEIEIADDVIVKTWNNDLSDYMDGTLLHPESEIFKSASALSIGQTVRFSGSFRPGSEGECLKESSLTLHGKLKNPEFIFKFASVDTGSK